MNLENQRKKIDEIDKHIQTLLRQRLDICCEIALIKKKSRTAVFDEDREKQILNEIKEVYPAPYDHFIADVYRSIMDSSKEFQKLQMQKEEK